MKYCYASKCSALQLKTWEGQLINLKKKSGWTAIGGEGDDKELRLAAFLKMIVHWVDLLWLERKTAK